MSSRHPHGRDIESPFLSEELFVRETEWQPRSAALEALTPFQNAFDKGPTSTAEEAQPFVPQELETDARLRKKLKSLSFLPHSVASSGREAPLSPLVMDPGIYD